MGKPFEFLSICFTNTTSVFHLPYQPLSKECMFRNGHKCYNLVAVPPLGHQGETDICQSVFWELGCALVPSVSLLCFSLFPQ